MENLHIIFFLILSLSIINLLKNIYFNQNKIISDETIPIQITTTIEKPILEKPILEEKPKFIPNIVFDETIQEKAQKIIGKTEDKILEDVLKQKIEEEIKKENELPLDIKSINTIDEPKINKVIQKITDNYEDKISIIKNNNSKIKNFLFINYPDNDLKISWDTAKNEIINLIKTNLQIINPLYNQLNSDENKYNYFKNPFFNKNSPEQFRTLISYRSGYQRLLQIISDQNLDISVLRNTYNNFFNL